MVVMVTLVMVVMMVMVIIITYLLSHKKNVNFPIRRTSNN